MQPLTKIATGFVIVFGAIRLNGFDLLSGPVGWGLCASGLAQLRQGAGFGGVGFGFGRAGFSAIAMAFIAFFAVFEPAPNMYGPPAFPFQPVIGLVDALGALVTVWLI